MGYIIFILAVCLVVLYNKYDKLKNDTDFIKSIIERYGDENSAIKKEIAELKKIIHEKTIITETTLDSIDIPKTPEVEIVPEAVIKYTPNEKTAIVEENSIIEITKTEESKPHFESQPVSWAEKQIPIEEEIYEESAFSKFIKKAEKQFADNWTGILGTAIMVLGIGYLSIYTALKVTPLFRVLILWLYAGLLTGSYLFLQKKEKWISTGLWLRSAGASLFLFGCYGASQIPALSFISNSIIGYSLIGLGITLNLYIGYIIKKQTFLSLHVILSMLILCVIPEKTIATFVLAATTATIGIVLSYKEKWEYHLLIVIIAFITFDIWFNVQGTKLSTAENILAIFGILTVAGSCMFMQYRSVYENSIFDKNAFITHLTNWVLFASGLILHATGSHFKTFILFVGAVVCLFVALKARKKKIFWLYHLDGMVSFILLALSIIMLNDWKVGMDIISCVLYLLIIVCLFVVYQNKETLLHKIFLIINHLAGIGLIVFSVLMINNTLDETKITSVLATIMALSIIAVSVPIFTAVKKEFQTVDSFLDKSNFSLNGLLAIVFSVLLILKSIDAFTDNLFVIVVFAIALIWCYLRQKFKNNTFDTGRLIFYGLSILICILTIKIQDKSYFDFLFSFGLFAVITFNWNVKYYFKNDFIIRFIGIIGVNALLLLLIHKYLTQHEIVQIFSLFGIAVLNHEFLWINFKKNSLTKDNQTLLYNFYYFAAILGSVSFLYHIANFSKPEIGLTCLGISIIEIYVLFAKRIRNKSENTTEEYTNFNLLNSELLVFNVFLFGFSCLQTDYVSVYFALLAIITFLGYQNFKEFRRFNNYSFFLLIAGIVITIYTGFNNRFEENNLFNYLTQLTTILISVGYSYLQLKSKVENGKKFITLLPYIQNSWILLLLFIQVEINYLPLFILVLALINFWLIAKNKINIEFHVVPILALLAVAISVYYSFDVLNGFTVTDWILQLGSVLLGILLTILLKKKESGDGIKSSYYIVVNAWLSLIMFSQLEHKWLPVFWISTAIMNLYFNYRKITKEKNISIVYFLLANIHLGFLSFHFFEFNFLAVYLSIFALLAVYIYLAYKWMEDFKLKNSLLIYPATLSIGFFLYLTFDKGALTFFWIVEALGLLILGILLKEKYFRHVSLSLVGICVIRLMFFDLSNADFLIRAMVLLGVGIVLLVMNSLFKKYKERFD